MYSSGTQLIRSDMGIQIFSTRSYAPRSDGPIDGAHKNLTGTWVDRKYSFMRVPVLQYLLDPT